MMSQKAGSIWAGYQAPWDKIVFAIEVGQRYLMENTTLGIPAMFQSEGTIARACSRFYLLMQLSRRSPWFHR